MQISQRARIAQIVGGEAAGFTAGQPLHLPHLDQRAAAMPKIAKYLKDTVKAGSIAVVWVNNDFGKGGRDTILPELEKGRHQGYCRRLHRAGPGRFHRRRDQGEERQCRRRLRLPE
jgi:ABC-type branched-subunit amino acid transport system substrate-binding protein